MKTAKRILILLIPAIIMFVAIVAVLNSPAAAYADKANYSYNVSNFIYRNNGNAVALFYDGEVDTDVYYRIQIDDAEPYDLKGSNYFTYAGTAVKLWFVRDEDDDYNAYLSAEQTLAKNTDLQDLILLPYGQKASYTGRSLTTDDVTFKKGVTPTDAINVDVYTAELNYEDPVVVPFSIELAEVIVTPKPFSRRYGEKTGPSEMEVIGDISDEDKEDILSRAFPIYSFDKNSFPGVYAVTAHYYDGDDPSPNYVVNTRDGEATILSGLLTGFTYNDESVLFDGEPHSIAVQYDASNWQGLDISYDTTPMTEEGKYTYTVTVRKEHYEDLVMSAVLTIRTLIITGNNLDKFVTVSGSSVGYDPTIEVTLVDSRVENISDKVASSLKSGVGYQEKVLFAYDVKFALDGSEIHLDPGTYNVAIKLSDLKSVTGVRILRYNGTEFKEVKYVYEDGYIKFSADGLDGFVFVKRSTVGTWSTSNVIIIAGIALAVVILFGVIVTSFTKSGKARRRSRKRHSRWA